MSEEAEPRSEIQQDWQEIALRLRIVFKHTLSHAEVQAAKADDSDYVEPKHLHDLMTAALSLFSLERMSASLDAAMAREKGWQ